MLLAFDADGPLIDFTGGLCSALRVFGFDVWPYQVHHWDLRKAFSIRIHDVVDGLLMTEGFCAQLDWMPGARELVHQLRADGHDVICVTSPHQSKHWMHERRERLHELFDDNDILFVKGPRKALVAADVLVEDHPGNAVKWCEAHEGHAGVALLVDRPWNSVRASEWAVHPGMVRVVDNQILQWVRSL